MKRVLRALVFLLVMAIVLPPAWFMAFPAPEAPPLPKPGTRLFLANGQMVNVLSEGEGPPIVMVHGLPGTAYEWRNTSPELAALGHRAIAYDRVGYGRSAPRKDGRFTPEGNAADLLAVLDAMGLRKATVVGWSYGGATAMAAAAQAPERIRRLVLVGTGGPDSPDAMPPEPSFAMRAFYSDPMLRYRRAIPPLSLGLMKLLSDLAFNGGPQPGWWIEGVEANFARWETMVSYREEMMNLTAETLEEFDPKQIVAPTLLLHGDEDQLAPVAISRYLASVIPDATLVEYPGASHMLPVTHAAEIAKQISDFSR
jgi:pimeloyl-ACP methyl ester carboxylesterase